MKVDYSKGKIYKITNDYNNEIYVGSTCDTLAKRFSNHKKDSKKGRCENMKIYKLMNEIGFDRFRIELIENYPCEDKYQLRQKEGYHIRQIGTLNMKIECRTMKEWAEENNDYMKEFSAAYEKLRIRPEEYFEKRKEKIQCDCGMMISKANIAQHKKSLNHTNLLSNLQNNIPSLPEH